MSGTTSILYSVWEATCFPVFLLVMTSAYLLDQRSKERWERSRRSSIAKDSLTAYLRGRSVNT